MITKRERNYEFVVAPMYIGIFASLRRVKDGGILSECQETVRGVFTSFGTFISLEE